MRRTPSIQLGLGLKLGGLVGLFGLVCAAFISFQLSQIDETARHLRLRRQFDELTAAIVPRTGALSFGLSDAASRLYTAADPQEFYAAWDDAGTLLAASSNAFTIAVGETSGHHGPPLGESEMDVRGDTDDPVYLWTERVGVGGHMLRVAVGHRAWAGDRLLRDIEITLLQRSAWVAAPLGLLVLLTSAFVIRRSFQPVRLLALQAATIGPDKPGQRLAHPRLPAELSHLIQATNEAAARMEAALARQLRFTADAAHQLQTPLAILSARLDAGLEVATAEGARADLRRMSHLIDRLLQMSQASGRLEALAPLNLTYVARETVAALVSHALRQGKTLSFSAPSVPCIIDGASLAVAEALSNLIENALQHSLRGGSVDVEVSQSGSVTVTDDGPGLCASVRGRIFEPFVTTRRADGGTGLGLAIVAEIMEQHGGHVEAVNHSCRGAVFKLHFRPNLIEAKRITAESQSQQRYAAV